jgi:hypothetical protein
VQIPKAHFAGQYRRLGTAGAADAQAAVFCDAERGGRRAVDRDRATEERVARS